jgi:D-sedoheptulose 7-phosphate isomerase
VAAEFVNRFRIDREPLPALALTTDSSILTSIANDSSFGDIFSRQVEALGSSADVLLCISTSGQSANVLKALATARGRGMVTIGLTGEKGGQGMEPLCDFCLVVPSADTARIQECHEFVLHVLSGMVETRLFEIQSDSGGGAG